MKALSVIAALLVAGSLQAADVDGFKPLFNGKDLTGWVPVNVHPGTFFVKDGEIVTTGKPTGYMRTDRQYENFVLEMDWMHVNKTEIGNSGLFVWGDVLPVPGSPFTRGIEVQVLVNLTYKDKEGRVTASSHGDVFSIQGATCKPDRPHPNPKNMRCIPSEFLCKGGGEWNHYKVTANNGTIKLEVNGKEVSGVSECKPHRKGYLALESEGAECHFKNIKIKELPSTNPKPEEVGPLAQGHVNLLTGIELLNWKATDEHKKHWTFRDHVLVYDGKAEAVGLALWTERDYGDIELTYDWRMPAKAKGEAKAMCAIQLGGKKGPSLSFRDDSATLGYSNGDRGFAEGASPEPGSIKPPGQWNRTIIVLKSDRLTASVNGNSCVDKKLPGTPEKGQIGIYSNPSVERKDTPLEFANIFVRELKEK